MIRFTNFPIRKDLVDKKDLANHITAMYCITVSFVTTVWVFGALIYTMVKY